ncbi:MAG: hypothetical protein ACK5QC_00820 [Bacteroidota bacterium]
MITTGNSLKVLTPAENKKGIENHKVIAAHLEAAAKNHLEAAKHHAEENHEKAARSTIIAQDHLVIANEAQKEDAKAHTNII